MRKRTLLSSLIALALGLTTANAQLYNYTTDLSGSPASVAANTSGSNLGRVNGALAATGCSDGFNSNRFAEATTYSTARPAMEFSITPNSGYQLDVTALSVNARRNNKGPVSWRLAYSTDGGATWVDNGTDYTVAAVACGTANTLTWDMADFSTYNSLKVRVFAYGSLSNLNGVATAKNVVLSGAVSFADVDGDGYTSDTDCNDANAAINPGASEVCDGIDNNCNGNIDEGVQTTFYADADGDGYGDAASTTLACSVPAGFVADATDCNDANASINPGAAEVCNGIDDNCDGNIDEGLTFTTYYADADGDTYGDAASTVSTCDGAPAGYVADATDCNDADGAVNPSATEVCNGIDDNCDGNIDEGLTFTTYYADADGDTYGDAASTVSTCDGAPAGYVADATDCNDADGAVNPSAPEVCNGIDDNCNGNIDEGVQTTFYADADGDGYGDVASTTLACSVPAGYVADATDCNDANASINPGAAEVCNGIDDNCDGNIDEGVLVTFYADADSDTFGNGASTAQACSAPVGYVGNSTDCNDASATVYPGAAEICGNGIDEDCDGTIDVIATIVAGGSTTFCTGGSVTLTCTTGGTGLAYQWVKNGANILGATSSTLNVTLQGNYKCIVTKPACSSTSSIITVTVNITPNASIGTPDGTDLCGKSNVRLKANTGVGLTYQWYLNGSVIGGATANIYYATVVGNYQVAVTTAAGCSKTSAITTVILSCRMAQGAIASVDVMPNPSNGNFELNVNMGTDVNGNANITVMNIAGQVVAQMNGNIANGQMNLSVSIPQVAGVYMVVIEADGAQITKQIMVTE